MTPGRQLEAAVDEPLDPDPLELPPDDPLVPVDAPDVEVPEEVDVDAAPVDEALDESPPPELPDPLVVAPDPADPADPPEPAVAADEDEDEPEEVLAPLLSERASLR